MSSPPCRRVADSSRHLRGWPSACWFSSVGPFSLPPVMLVFSSHFFFSLRITHSSFILLVRTFSLFIHCCSRYSLIVQPVASSVLLYKVAWFSPLLKDSLLGAILTVSGRWFHFSTIRTANECFLMSVRAYWTASPW